MSKLQNYSLYFFNTDTLPQGVTEFCSLLYHDFFFLMSLKLEQVKKFKKLAIYAGIYLSSKKKVLLKKVENGLLKDGHWNMAVCT